MATYYSVVDQKWWDDEGAFEHRAWWSLNVYSTSPYCDKEAR